MLVGRSVGWSVGRSAGRPAGLPASQPVSQSVSPGGSAHFEHVHILNVILHPYKVLIVNLHRSTRTNEYAGMQMFLTTNLKRDWSA